MKSKIVYRALAAKIVVILVSAIIIALFVVPFILITLSAFSTSQEYYDFTKIVPTRFTLDHFNALFIEIAGWESLINSLQVVALTIAISFSVGVPASYALSRFHFAGRNSLKLVILGTRMFPVIILAVPLLIIFLRLGLDDSLLGVAIAHSTMILPIVILVSSSVLGSVSVDFEEAGMIFGLSRAQAFFRITLPLALPGLVASAILAFIMSWNEVFIATILNLTNRTLPAHIFVAAMDSPDYLRFTAGFIMSAPTLFFIFLVRKHLVTMWGISLK